ncbi:MAG: hypothetical protein JXQ72_08655, partial [Anaerolineae bacterium]|nr:hypothetical protein [Anaerolineae bacterium]
SDGSGLPPFPTHEHLGGLYLFAGSTPWLPGFEAWAWETVTRFNTYFVQCPPAWSAIEDPVLMERIALFTREMQQPDLTAGDPFAFEEFPREPLKFPVTRRQLFSSMRTNLEVASGKAEGGTALQLADLGSAPDSALAGLMPQVLPGCTITVEQNMVFGQAPDGPRPLPLFPLDSPALQVFNLFNGQTPLAEVSRQLADMHVWPRQRSFAYVRGVFLTLVLCGLCLPTG